MIPEKAKRGYSAGIMLLMFIFAVCTTTQGTLLSDFINYYDLRSSAQGLMSSFQSAGNLLVLMLIWFYNEKLRKNVVIMVSAYTVSAIFFILGGKPFYLILLFCYGFYGVCAGALDSLASSVMVDIYRDNAPKYMNILHGFYGLGGLAGPLVFQMLDGAGLSWNQVLLVMGALSLAGAVLYSAGALPAMKKDVSGAPLINRLRAEPMNAIDYLKDNKKALLMACAFLYGAHQIAIMVWTPRYISEYLSAPKWGPMALSAYWIGTASARLIVSRFKFEPIKLIYAGNLISGLAFTAGVLSGNGFFMMVCCLISGFAEGAVLPSTLYLACLWEKDNTALGSSMIMFAHYAGAIITPPVIGFLIMISGSSVAMMIPAIAPLAAGAMAVYLARLSAAQNT